MGLGITAGQIFMAALAAAFSATTSYKQKRQQKAAQKQFRKMMESGTGHLLNIRDTQEPLPIIYGQAKVGGSQVWVGATGTNNKYLHMVQTICEGEIDSLVNIWLDDKPYTDYGSYVVYEFATGTASQTVNSTIQTNFPDWDDPMRHTAYLYLKLQYEQRKGENPNFDGVPIVTTEVKGRKVLDPRTSITTWSNNPPLCTWDLFMNKRFGTAIQSEWWDVPSVGDNATWCSSKGYVMDAIIKERRYSIDYMKDLTDSFRSDLIWTGVKYKFIAYDNDAAVMTLTEDKVKEQSWSIELPSIQKFPNSFKFKFYNKNNYYVLDDVYVKDTSAISLDGEEREVERTLIGAATQSQVQKIGAFLVDRERLDRIHHCVTHPDYGRLEPGDMVNVQHSLPGWSSASPQKCRVTAIAVENDYEVRLSLREENALIYDDIINISSHQIYSTTLPDPGGTPPSVVNVQITEEEYQVKDNTSVRMKVTWSVPTDYAWLDRVEVWVSYDGGSNYNHYLDSDDTGTSGSFTIDGVKDGETWHIKLLSVSIQNKKQKLADVSPYIYTTTGITTPPANITGFGGLSTGDAIHLKWNEISMKNLAMYELRYGTAWGTSMFFGSTKGVMFSITGMKPGVHNFLVKGRDTLDNYSSSAALTTITVFTPPGYSSKHCFGNDWTTGSHQNTERYVDPSSNVWLRTIHAGSLSGRYNSTVFDISSIYIRRWWIDYTTQINAAAATWEGMFPLSGQVWTDKLQAGETWVQEFANVQAGQMTAKFQYSETSSTWYDIENFHILSTEVQARYLKYQIDITDTDSGSSIYVSPTSLQAMYWQ